MSPTKSRKMIVTTTIHPVTEAIEKYQTLSDWELIVVGDQQTPRNYPLKQGVYLSPKTQTDLDPNLSKAIGWDCTQRRNFGILYAYKHGADIVALVNDNHLPNDDWGKDLLLEKTVEVNFYKTEAPAFDPIGVTNEKHLWHRGFPLQLLRTRDYKNVEKKSTWVDIQADLWDGSPDVDAICKLEHAPTCQFDPKHFPLSANKPMPFNAKNTFLSRRVLKDYFLFPQIGRLDDIWASYYVQSKGFLVVFNRASVNRIPNPKDLIQDMRNEYLGYEKNLEFISSLQTSPDGFKKLLPRSSLEAFNLYQRHFRAT